ncbi:hypothetical protein [Pseudonocardia sp. MH-G8]|nr:hypothetical protein [Pseudonocardia sp. MH-G8]
MTARLGDVVRNQGYRRQAARIGEMVRAEAGLRQGVDVLEGLAPT